MINAHLQIWASVWADEPKELPPSPTLALPLLSVENTTPEVSIMACGGKKKGSKKKGK